MVDPTSSNPKALSSAASSGSFSSNARVSTPLILEHRSRRTKARRSPSGKGREGQGLLAGGKRGDSCVSVLGAPVPRRGRFEARPLACRARCNAQHRDTSVDKQSALIYSLRHRSQRTRRQDQRPQRGCGSPSGTTGGAQKPRVRLLPTRRLHVGANLITSQVSHPRGVSQESQRVRRVKSFANRARFESTTPDNIALLGTHEFS